MIKRAITYTDFNDNNVTENYYFNLTSTEVIEVRDIINSMFLRVQDLAEKFQENGDDKNIKDATENDFIVMYKLLKPIILFAVGERSDDGKKFIKNADFSNSFSNSEAFSKLMVDLLGDPEELQSFIRGVMPKQLYEESQAQIAKSNGNVVELLVNK